MKTLFLICGSAFAASALAWFFTWAIFVHSTAAAYGTGPDSMDMPMPPEERERMEIAREWARWFRTATLILFGAAATTAALALYSNE